MEGSGQNKEQKQVLRRVGWVCGFPPISHLFLEKPRNGWGTGHLWEGKGRKTKADPSTHHLQAEEYAWGPVFRGIFRAHDRLVFRATGRTFPWHARSRFQGGERGCTGQQARECHAWKLLSLGRRGRLLVLHEYVCLMTAHTRLAFHEWIRLQLRHLIAVTVVTCA